MSKESSKALQEFYKLKGICEKCGREPLMQGHKSLGIKCRNKHVQVVKVANKRLRIYKLIESLFPMIYPKRKQKALETMEKIKKKIKALSSCYRAHAD